MATFTVNLQNGLSYDIEAPTGAFAAQLANADAQESGSTVLSVTEKGSNTPITTRLPNNAGGGNVSFFSTPIPGGTSVPMGGSTSISNVLEPPDPTPDPTPPTGNEDVLTGAQVPGMGGFFSFANAPSLEQTFYDPSNYQQFGRFFERRLVREENRNGAVYRFYEYNEVGDRGDVVFDGYVLVAPGQDNVYSNPFSVEYHVTDEAFNNNKNWNTLEPTDLK
jgi:hypothetical protein